MAIFSKSCDGPFNMIYHDLRAIYEYLSAITCIEGAAGA